MAKHKPTYNFLPISVSKPIFRVILTSDDDAVVLGTVQKIKIRHLHRKGWEATLPDGRHMAVHDSRWQASLALKWAYDGQKGYPPFPFASSRRAEVERI